MDCLKTHIPVSYTHLDVYKRQVLYGNVLTISELGTSQGAVISPLLSNIYLNTLDRLWEKYGHTHGILVRYADDTCLLYTSDLILYAQTLGLNTWWCGGMFNGKGALKHLESANVCVNGVIAIGYGQTHILAIIRTARSAHSLRLILSCSRILS